MTSVLDVAKQINKKYKNGGITIGGELLPHVKKLGLGTLGSDFPLYGGIPYGSIAVFAGQYSSGKSTAAALAMANYQKENPDKTCVYVDVENTLPVQLSYMEEMTGLLTQSMQVLNQPWSRWWPSYNHARLHSFPPLDSTTSINKH